MAPRNRFAVAVVLLALLTSHSIGEPYLVGLGQDISVRDELVQGWALVEKLCPDGTGGCGKRSCCPIGSYCDTNEATNSNLCCPTSTSSSCSQKLYGMMTEIDVAQGRGAVTTSQKQVAAL